MDNHPESILDEGHSILFGHLWTVPLPEKGSCQMIAKTCQMCSSMLMISLQRPNDRLWGYMKDEVDYKFIV